MDKKTCFKCGEEKAVSEYYKHGQMSAGVLGKCKECTKRDVRENRKARAEHYHEYEKKRFQTASRKEQLVGYQRKMREREPQKYKARTALGNAVRDGKIVRPESCPECGKVTKIQAHHDDYSKPLEVKWCCFKCHRENHHGQKCH